MAETKKTDATPDKTAELEARIEALEGVIADQQNTIDKLQEDKTGRSIQIAKPKPKPQVPQETFKVGKKTYQFSAFAFVYQGEKILASAALKDKALLKALVESGSTVVREV